MLSPRAPTSWAESLAPSFLKMRHGRRLGQQLRPQPRRLKPLQMNEIRELTKTFNQGRFAKSLYQSRLINRHCIFCDPLFCRPLPSSWPHQPSPHLPLDKLSLARTNSHTTSPSCGGSQQAPWPFLCPQACP